MFQIAWALLRQQPPSACIEFFADNSRKTAIPCPNRTRRAAVWQRRLRRRVSSNDIIRVTSVLGILLYPVQAGHLGASKIATTKKPPLSTLWLIL
jgi:hypothetical protein